MNTINKTNINKTNINKVKGLLPALRERKRYLLFETISQTPVEQKEVEQAILLSMNKLYGQVGTSRAGLIFVKEEVGKNRGLIRVAHTCVDELKMALIHTTNIAGTPTLINSISVSGILKKAKEAGACKI